ncbi:hypothetical protein ZHAS_00005923 [Anopheles sinensis]|uniref:Uncharacterized protein n=1 Tax=Anopheles sinensis TaxID=74873 RepID=A0A084VKM1_ANOSI|nr:hypothetical protein ZHAS_00005923 [Anopheles sinensis]
MHQNAPAKGNGPKMLLLLLLQTSGPKVSGPLFRPVTSRMAALRAMSGGRSVVNLSCPMQFAVQ